jgi:hypothetical protein
MRGRRTPEGCGRNRLGRAGGGCPPPLGHPCENEEGIMIVLYFLIVFLLASVLMLVEGVLRANWTKAYFNFGIKIYERKFLQENKNLIDVYTALQKYEEQNPVKIIQYHLTIENDYIFYRNTFSKGLYKSSSLLHGAINHMDGTFIIIGFLGITELLYMCFLPFLLYCTYFLSHTQIIIPIILLALVGNILYYYSSYSKTKNYLNHVWENCCM